MRQQCRIWWPKELLCRPSSSTVLFGWFLSCSSASLDIVVAFGCDEASVSLCRPNLQDILDKASGNLPINLQEKAIFSILGHCVADFSSNGPFLKMGNDEDDQMNPSTHCCESTLNSQHLSVDNYGLQSCGCCRKFCQPFTQDSNWIQLLYESHKFFNQKDHWIPKLHHLHWNGQTVSDCDLHVILYETPRFGAHHYSLGFQNSSEQAKSAVKKPNWVNKIQQKQPLFELESVITALNSAAAAKSFFKEHVESQAPFVRFSIICMLAAFTRKLFAVCISIFSTLFYIILQCLYRLWYRSQLQIFVTVMKVFITTCKIIQMRCSQILYWPVFLQAYGPRSQSCVEYAEKTTSHNHSMWSGVAVDVILGNLIGLALLIHSEFVCVWVFNFANDITNNFLRTGSVWLMGAPAGFKLNTELARILGMISLNVIQIWSTLWFFLGFCFVFFIRGLAVCGILFGATVPAAMIIDMITLATSHISTLHWLISFLYSHQILALAALWRLFRGRKWNPLRKRLDSYHYTVDQHIVGSLLFTPLLLLLPTTSVFYIFFTIMNTSISLTCVLIEVIISIIHATPYTEIFIWLVRRQRFPSGIWFEILSCQNNEVKPTLIKNSKDSGLPLQYSWQRIDTPGSGCSVLIYLLHSNFLSIGQIVMPHYRQVFSGVSGHFVGSLAYGVLTGRRIPSSLGIVPTSKMPWMSIPCKEYWCLCRDSVLARKQ